MCAQGQVLHLLGGMSPRQIKDIAGRARADFETAKLLNISISHAILLSNVNDSVDGAPSIVLTHPEKVLGPGAIGVLRMWLHFDRMTGEQWRDAWAARGTRAAESAWAARYAWAAWAARDGLAARYAWDVLDARDAAYCAVAEMAGIKFMPEHRKGEFVFLPMFGFAVPDAVPLLLENYGTAST